MRYLVLSDIHANSQALEAVLADASPRGHGAVVVLGDLVGYGADPSAVLARVLALLPHVMVRGNHDKVCAGLERPAGFSDVARIADEWTAEVLTPAERQQLAALPEGPREVAEGILACHGSPFDEDYYIFGSEDARRSFAAVPARCCLFGHTHRAAAYASAGAWVPAWNHEAELPLPARGQLLVNVGSVGQPRDGDPRAAYGILDLDAGTLRLHRVEYDVAAAQKRILEAGLPEVLAERLADGR
jgi:diadenosine tetraphosphatase ApaH/serine/threonine PP2A family protein phosphatase